MKLGVFTVMLPDLSPEDAAPALKQAGYDGVEWRVTHIPAERKQESPSFWGNNLCTFDITEADAAQAKQLAASANLDIPSLGTYISVGSMDEFKQTLSFAEAAGAPAFRVRMPRNQTPYWTLFQETQTFLAEAIKLASAKNIKILIEIHQNSIVTSASSARLMLQDFDPAQIGVIHDAGNMAREGFEHYQMGLEMLGAHLSHVHVKNAAYSLPSGDEGVWEPCWSPLEYGVVDFKMLFKALKAVGYDGWLVVEDFSQKRPTLDALSYNRDFVHRHWDAA
ncbi:MAG: sugar phosphate isomerase/epimerase [Deinococcota bacterium]